MALAGASGPEFDGVVVVLNERHHPQQHHIACPRRQRCWLKADTSEQEVAPFIEGEQRSSPREVVQSIMLRELDLAEGFDPERTTTALLGNARVIGQLNLR